MVPGTVKFVSKFPTIRRIAKTGGRLCRYTLIFKKITLSLIGDFYKNVRNKTNIYFATMNSQMATGDMSTNFKVLQLPFKNISIHTI